MAGQPLSGLLSESHSQSVHWQVAQMWLELNSVEGLPAGAPIDCPAPAPFKFTAGSESVIR